MATVKENAEEYINKLYDATQDKQKQMLTDAYKVNTEALDTEKQNVQNQTNQYLERTNVEAQRVDQQYKPENVSSAVNQQAALTMENQQKKNTQTIQNQQQNANAEYERLRKLYADQFAAEIKKAQAENDKARAEQLYEAAKAKEHELQTFVYGMGELDNQALIDQIYNNATEAATQEINAQKAEKLSELAAQQQAKQQQTDEALTQTYVDALRKNQNMAEYQNARGMGSGNVAQARLARDMGTTEALTELRRAQMADDANFGAQRVEAGKTAAESVADVAAENERKRAQAMYAEALTQQPKAVASVGGTSGKRGGSSGTYDPAVLEQQKYLNSIGYNVAEDGVMGSQTAGAQAQLDKDRESYKVVNKNNSAGVQVGNGGMSWESVEAAVNAGTVKEIVDDKNKTVQYVKVRG